MAKGYVIFVENIHDQPAYDAYVAKAVPTLMGQGGKAIVFDATGGDVIEGQWPGRTTVVLEFPSVDAAKAWYNSPEYQAIAPERHKAADCSAAIFGGLDM